jgi:hypothetical protein
MRSHLSCFAAKLTASVSVAVIRPIILKQRIANIIASLTTSYQACSVAIVREEGSDMALSKC